MPKPCTQRPECPSQLEFQISQVAASAVRQPASGAGKVFARAILPVPTLEVRKACARERARARRSAKRGTRRSLYVR